jgi:hypothetical protein
LIKEEVISYLIEKQNASRKNFPLFEKKKKEVEIFLTEPSSSRLKFYILNLISKIKIRKINRELASLEKEIAFYEQVKLELKKNQYNLAIQVIDKDIDDLFTTVDQMSILYPDIDNVILKPRSSSEFRYLMRLKQELLAY